MLAQSSTVDYCPAGDVVLQCGVTLPGVELVVAAYGSPDSTGGNVVVFPTRFGGTHEDNEYLIGAGKALDPERYFILVPNLLGNGVSTSPSTAIGAFAGGHFPPTTIYDDVMLQRRVLAEHYGVKRVHLAVGWSMGGQQAYHWAALFPDEVDKLAVICGSARTSLHNQVFLEGMRAALTADGAWNEGAYDRPPERGLRAIGRAWAGWGVSQAFYRAERFRDLGYASLEDYLVRYWEGLFLSRDANNVLSMLHTWKHADVSANDIYRGDYDAALGSIEADTVLMPGRTDLYFPPEDSELECALVPNARVATIPSIWGHYAGGGRSQEDLDFIDRELRRLLAGD